MNKKIANDLEYSAKMVANRFSMREREGNFNNETFFVQEIIPISDHSAVCVFEKNTGKRALAFFYYIPRGSSMGWKYFFPTDSHLLGFRAFDYYKLEVERYNFKYNFE